MNALRILEISWLVFGLLGVGLCFYNLAIDGVAAAAWPLLFTLIAGVFYTVRRKQRIAYEKQQQETSATTQE
jgi:hypothetical protein